VSFCSSLLSPALDDKNFADIITFLCFGENAIFKDVNSILELTHGELNACIEKLSEIHEKQKEEMAKMKSKSRRK